MPVKQDVAKQDRLLNAILARVPQKGWTELAVAAAVKDSRLSVDEGKRLFAAGIKDVIRAFEDKTDQAVRQKIRANRRFAAMRVRDKVTFGVRARLEFLAEHRAAVQRLVVWYALPTHLPHAVAHLWHVADFIWGEAGDTSTDYNRYTKRLLLAAVFKATLIFWLNDISPDYRETWAFLDRRIADAMALGKGASAVKAIGLGNIVKFMRGKMTA